MFFETFYFNKFVPSRNLKKHSDKLSVIFYVAMF